MTEAINDRDEPELCPCGRPLHYANNYHRRQVERLIEELGPTIPITVSGRTWVVSRHYIALHGIRARELPTLGFPEVRGGGTS